MSRIGNKLIEIPSGVKVHLDNDSMIVESSNNKLSKEIPPKVNIDIGEENIQVKPINSSREARAMQGLARSLLASMIQGVTKGFIKNLKIVGVGYRASINGNTLNLNVGYSNPINYKIPENVKITVSENTNIQIEGADKQLVGEVAATIRRFRRPEPYKGKGIRYADEKITLKEGKSVG